MPAKITKSVILLVIPLIISSFTHLWNPLGFPPFFVDEGHYMRRTLQVLNGLGVQESVAVYDYPYDHPYFGQLFLAGLLWITGYPSSLQVSDGPDLKNSIEMLHSMPRIIMGILAVLDTLLIFKITELYYNRNVAFFASILFAAMPITWMFRMILLDTLLLPFLLLSILFLLYYRNRQIKQLDRVSAGLGNKRSLFMVILSGIFFGLALFTKESAVFMIPPLLYLILSSKSPTGQSIKRFRILATWFIPVGFFLFLWPAIAIFQHQFDNWISGVSYQVVRQEKELSTTLQSLFSIDPVIMILTLIALVLATKKEYLFLLWIIPYSLFILILGANVRYFHFIPLVPAFCILSGNLVVKFSQIGNKNRMVVRYILVTSIVIFGLVCTILLVSTNLTTIYFNLYPLIVKAFPSQHNDGNNAVTMIGSHWMRNFYWIPKYIFNKNLDFKVADPILFFNGTQPSSKTMLLISRNLNSEIRDAKLNDAFITQLRSITYNTSVIGTINENWTALGYPHIYPYNVFDILLGPLGKVDLRTNY
ncbi:MAG: glycosyltransferase family 39 protein [Nitrososphaerales archaeon]